MIATPYNLNRKQAGTNAALLPEEDQVYVAEGFSTLLPLSPAIERHLRGVVTDTLAHPGSLARAHLAFSLMRSFGFKPEVARQLGVAIEYFHTASLLLDDLPCMDNATMRRGHACAHVAHGESAAILGALSLITQAYHLLWSVLNDLPAEQRRDASDLVRECLGVDGILNGQSYDLHFSESNRTREDVLRVAQGKTVTLIRLTLLLPVAVHGSGTEMRAAFERLASAWGMAYQILDDFKDLVMSASETGKTTSRDEQLDHPNLPRVMGVSRAAGVLGEQLAESRAILTSLSRRMGGTDVLERLQSMLESESARVASRLAAPDFEPCVNPA